MNKKKIESLSEFLLQNSRWSNMTHKITEWFEKNPVEPVVVGLSDEQVKSFITHWMSGGNNEVMEYHEWARTQTFAQLDAKEVVVGLSDEQIKDFSKNCYVLESRIKEWLKTQTFAQSQLFEPRWDIIPSHVDEVEIVMNYCQDGMILDDESNFLIGYKRPKLPAPKVEVGQTWSKEGLKYRIYELDKMKTLGEKVDSVVFHHYDVDENSDDFELFERTLSSFLAKFERVGGF